MRNLIIVGIVSAFCSGVLADSIKKFESPVIENFVYYKIKRENSKWEDYVDAKGGKYVFDTCGTQELVEGKHYTLSKAIDYHAEYPWGASGPGYYFKISPGPDCK